MTKCLMQPSLTEWMIVHRERMINLRDVPLASVTWPNIEFEVVAAPQGVLPCLILLPLLDIEVAANHPRRRLQAGDSNYSCYCPRVETNLEHRHARDLVHSRSLEGFVVCVRCLPMPVQGRRRY